MEIILVEEMANLGEVGDIVSVKPGYARNYLFPRGIAIPANERQKRRVAKFLGDVASCVAPR